MCNKTAFFRCFWESGVKIFVNNAFLWKKFIIATLNSAGLTNGCEDEKKGNLFGFLFFIAEREGFELSFYFITLYFVNS